MKRLLAIAVLTACATSPPPMATQSDAVRAHADLAALEQGRELLVKKCGGSCHRAPLPSAHTAAEWPHKLDEMAGRAGLEPGQRALIEQYLVTMARR